MATEGIPVAFQFAQQLATGAAGELGAAFNYAFGKLFEAKAHDPFPTFVEGFSLPIDSELARRVFPTTDYEVSRVAITDVDPLSHERRFQVAPLDPRVRRFAAGDPGSIGSAGRDAGVLVHEGIPGAELLQPIDPAQFAPDPEDLHAAVARLTSAYGGSLVSRQATAATPADVAEILGPAPRPPTPAISLADFRTRVADAQEADHVSLVELDQTPWQPPDFGIPSLPSTTTTTSSGGGLFDVLKSTAGTIGGFVVDTLENDAVQNLIGTTLAARTAERAREDAAKAAARAQAPSSATSPPQGALEEHIANQERLRASQARINAVLAGEAASGIVEPRGGGDVFTASPTPAIAASSGPGPSPLLLIALAVGGYMLWQQGAR